MGFHKLASHAAKRRSGTLLMLTIVALACIVGCLKTQFYVDNELGKQAPKFQNPTCQPIPVTMEVVCLANGKPNPKQDNVMRPKLVRILRSSGSFIEAENPADAWGGHVRVTVDEKLTFKDQAVNAGRAFLVGFTYGLVGQNLDGDVEVTFVHTPPSGEPIVKTCNHRFYIGVGLRLTPPSNSHEVLGPEFTDQVLEDAARSFATDQTLLARVNQISTTNFIARQQQSPMDITPVAATQPAAPTEVRPVETAHLPLPTAEPIVR